MGSLPYIVEDCQGVLQLFSDGSIFRSENIDFPFPHQVDDSIVWKDSLYDETHDLSLRLYKPVSKTISTKKLPVVYYIHGGGFCVGSRTWPHVRNSCQRLASSLHALVVSADYRLAPEHRLPAAIEDTVSSIEWISKRAEFEQDDDWFGDGVDFDRVFIVGDSSGGNIAHHVAYRLGSGEVDVGPVRVRGYVLMAPFFGGTTRTKSEEELQEGMLNLDILDRFWRLSLPIGVTRDHPLANPFGPKSPNLKKVDLGPILVVVGGGELLKDRAIDYYERLNELKKNISIVEFEGQQHGFFMWDPYSKIADKFIEVIKEFMVNNSD